MVTLEFTGTGEGVAGWKGGKADLVPATPSSANSIFLTVII